MIAYTQPGFLRRHLRKALPLDGALPGGAPVRTHGCATVFREAWVLPDGNVIACANIYDVIVGNVRVVWEADRTYASTEWSGDPEMASPGTSSASKARFSGTG